MGNTKVRGRLDTVAIWLNQERPTLLTSPAYGDAQRQYKCPNPPYLLYEYFNGLWTTKPLAQVGFDRLRSNMTSRVLERRSEIEHAKRNLSAEQTASSYAYRDGKFPVPYIIEFKGMPEQAFDEQICNYPSRTNYLLYNGGN